MALEFEEILKQARVQIADESDSHSREGWLNFDCPFCGRGSFKNHMGYSLLSRATTCYKCGKHKLSDTIAALLRITPQKARGYVARLPKRSTFKNEIWGRMEPPEHGEFSNRHANYLRRKGFDPEYIWNRWGVRGCGRRSKGYEWTLYIPIVSHGREVSWTTRTLTDEGRRYKNAPTDREGLPAGKLLYGHDYATKHVIVVEGPADVWNVGPGTVATLGLNYSEAQVNKLKKFYSVCICFDHGREERKRARSLAAELDGYVEHLSIYQTETATDAGGIEQEEIDYLRKTYLHKKI